MSDITERTGPSVFRPHCPGFVNDGESSSESVFMDLESFLAIPTIAAVKNLDDLYFEPYGDECLVSFRPFIGPSRVLGYVSSDAGRWLGYEIEIRVRQQAELASNEAGFAWNVGRPEQAKKPKEKVIAYFDTTGNPDFFGRVGYVLSATGEIVEWELSQISRFIDEWIISEIPSATGIMVWEGECTNSHTVGFDGEWEPRLEGSWRRPTAMELWSLATGPNVPKTNGE